MKTKLVRPVLLWLLVNSAMSFAQAAPDVFQGYTRANGIMCQGN